MAIYMFSNRPTGPSRSEPEYSSSSSGLPGLPANINFLIKGNRDLTSAALDPPLEVTLDPCARAKTSSISHIMAPCHFCRVRHGKILAAKT